MRIRKRRAQEVEHPPYQPSSCSAATLQRKQHNHIDKNEIEAERFELASTSGSEAAALSPVLLAAKAVPHAAQEHEVRQNNYSADAGVPFDDQFYTDVSLSTKEKLNTSSNSKILVGVGLDLHLPLVKTFSDEDVEAASGQSTSEESRKPQIVEIGKDKNVFICSIRETGSYAISSSEGILPAKVGEDTEISTRTVFEDEGGLTHPCNQAEGTLTHSLCSIFSELSGNVGLSAREALSKIQEKGLPGLIEGDGVPSVQVAKIMRSNPYFVPLRGGKYMFTRSPNSVGSERYEMIPDPEDEVQKSREAKEHTGVGYDRVSSSSKGEVSSTSEKEVTRVLETSSQVGNMGTRCTRVDGRSWQCRRTSLPGFSLCEHHHLQLSSQSRRQRNFQRAFNRSSRKRLRKGENKADARRVAPEGNKTWTAESGRRNVVKARSLEAIVRGTVDVGSVNSSPLIN